MGNKAIAAVDGVVERNTKKTLYPCTPLYAIIRRVIGVSPYRALTTVNTQSRRHQE